MPGCRCYGGCAKDSDCQMFMAANKKVNWGRVPFGPTWPVFWPVGATIVEHKWWTKISNPRKFACWASGA